jgi:hypothetical protein
MSPLLSWLFFATFLSLGLWVAFRFDSILDRVWTDDLAAARRRDEALKVMESWHPSQGPKPVHSVNDEAGTERADSLCNCGEWALYNANEHMHGGGVHAVPCPIHTEES